MANEIPEIPVDIPYVFMPHKSGKLIIAVNPALPEDAQKDAYARLHRQSIKYSRGAVAPIKSTMEGFQQPVLMFDLSTQPARDHFSKTMDLDLNIMGMLQVLGPVSGQTEAQLRQRETRLPPGGDGGRRF